MVWRIHDPKFQIFVIFTLLKKCAQRNPLQRGGKEEKVASEFGVGNSWNHLVISSIVQRELSTCSPWRMQNLDSGIRKDSWFECKKCQFRIAPVSTPKWKVTLIKNIWKFLYNKRWIFSCRGSCGFEEKLSKLKPDFFFHFLVKFETNLSLFLLLF